MLGGLSPAIASKLARPTPSAPTIDQIQMRRDQGYEVVSDSNARLSPQAADKLASQIEGTLGTRKATRLMNPKAAIAADDIAADLRASPPTISEVDEARQWIGQNVAGSVENGERRIGQTMKQVIDDHLDSLEPQDVTGTNNAEEIVAALKGARAEAQKVYKSELFEAEDTGLIAKGLRRAATTGSGGNVVNAHRQSIRRVLETPSCGLGFPRKN